MQIKSLKTSVLSIECQSSFDFETNQVSRQDLSILNENGQMTNLWMITASFSTWIPAMLPTTKSWIEVSYHWIGQITLHLVVNQMCNPFVAFWEEVILEKDRIDWPVNVIARDDLFKFSPVMTFIHTKSLRYFILRFYVLIHLWPKLNTFIHWFRFGRNFISRHLVNRSITLMLWFKSWLHSLHAHSY